MMAELDLPLWDTGGIIEALDSDNEETYRLFWAACSNGWIHLPAPVLLELLAFFGDDKMEKDRERVSMDLQAQDRVFSPSIRAFAGAGVLMRDYKVRNKTKKEDHKMDCLIASTAMEQNRGLVAIDSDFQNINPKPRLIPFEVALGVLRQQAQLEWAGERDEASKRP